MIRIPPMPASAEAFDRWCTRQKFANEALAEPLRVSRVTVWKWRTGKHPFNWMTWLACVAVAATPEGENVLGLTERSIPKGEGAFERWMKQNAFTNETLAAALRVSRATVWKWRSSQHPVEWITWLACNVVAGDDKDKQARIDAVQSIKDAQREAAQLVKRARERALARA